MRIYDLKQKEVINVKTCKRLGFVGDVDFDMETGCLLALIVPCLLYTSPSPRD